MTANKQSKKQSKKPFAQNKSIKLEDAINTALKKEVVCFLAHEILMGQVHTLTNGSICPPDGVDRH